MALFDDYPKNPTLLNKSLSVNEKMFQWLQSLMVIALYEKHVNVNDSYWGF